MLVGLFVRHSLYGTLNVHGSLHRKRRGVASAGIEPTSSQSYAAPIRSGLLLWVALSIELRGDAVKGLLIFQTHNGLAQDIFF